MKGIPVFYKTKKGLCMSKSKRKYEVEIIQDDYRKPSGKLRIGRKIIVRQYRTDSSIARQIVWIHQTVDGTLLENPSNVVRLTPDSAEDLAQTLILAAKIARGNAPHWDAYVKRELEKRNAFTRPKARKRRQEGSKIYSTMGITCA